MLIQGFFGSAVFFPTAAFSASLSEVFVDFDAPCFWDDLVLVFLVVLVVFCFDVSFLSAVFCALTKGLIKQTDNKQTTNLFTTYGSYL